MFESGLSNLLVLFGMDALVLLQVLRSLEQLAAGVTGVWLEWCVDWMGIG